MVEIDVAVIAQALRIREVEIGWDRMAGAATRVGIRSHPSGSDRDS
jgi:hypothetical protein